MPDELEHWAPHLARDLDRVRRDLPEILEVEADHLAATTRRLAPRRSGALRASIMARGPDVTSSVPYAVLQSEGGVIKALRRGWLTIPVRRGYKPGAGYVTVRGRDGHQYVVRSGSYDLWAVRRRQVRIRGSRYLDRALAAHLEQADERVTKVLVDEVTSG